ncbi:MAG: hypothetical protein MHM6MM_007010, partial [Cercozoa sp. M6MM]
SGAKDEHDCDETTWNFAVGYIVAFWVLAGAAVSFVTITVAYILCCGLRTIEPDLEDQRQALNEANEPQNNEQQRGVDINVAHDNNDNARNPSSDSEVNSLSGNSTGTRVIDGTVVENVESLSSGDASPSLRLRRHPTVRGHLYSRGFVSKIFRLTGPAYR